MMLASLLIGQLLILNLIKTFGIGFSDTIASICIFISVFAIIFDIKKSSVLKEYSLPLCLGLFFRLLLLYLDRYGQSFIILPNSGVDSEMFYDRTLRFMNGGNAERGGPFAMVIGSVFRITGDCRLYGQFIIVLFSLGSLVALAYTLRELNIPKADRYRTVAVISLLPNYAILGSIYLRESIVALPVSLACYSFVLCITRNRERYLLFALFFVFIGMVFHSGVIGVMVGFAVARALYDKKKKQVSLSIKRFFLVAIGSLVVLFILFQYGTISLTKIYNINSLEDIANVSDYGRLSYSQYVGNSNSIMNTIIYTIPRIFFFVVSPVPWQWGGPNDIIAFIFSSLFYVFVIVQSIRSLLLLQSGSRKTMLFLMVIVSFFAVFVYAWGVSNGGTAARHRDKLIPIFAIIFSLCRRKNHNRSLSINGNTVI